jgi:hypothetical protein
MRVSQIVIVAVTLAAAGSTSAFAGLITTSGSAPASAAISQPDFTSATFSGSQDFTDNAGPPGQTFTPASNLLLSAVTVKGFADTGASFGGSVNGGTWTMTVSQIVTGTMVNVSQETANPAAVTVGSDYVTFTLTTPVALTGGTQYAFDLFSSQGYFGFAKSSTDVYAGGAAIQHGTVARSAPTGASITNTQTVDRTFFINPVPEPSSVMVLGLGALGLLARRRRSA